LSLVSEPEQCQSNYWLQALLLEDEQANHRDSILKATNEAGLMTRPVWILLNELKPFSSCPYMDLSCAQSLAQRLINIPSSSGLASLA